MSKKSLHKKKTGFSLIELSIVLIILGLLIAGVTGGAALIKSAELRAGAVEANAWKAAVSTFVTKFENYPGDYNNNLTLGAAAVTTGAPASFSSGVTPKLGTGNAVGTTYFPNQNDTIEAENCEGVMAMIDLKNVGATDFIPFLPGNTAVAAGSNTCTTANAFALPSSTGTSTTGTLNPSKVKNAGWTFDGAVTGSANLMTLTNATTGGGIAFPGSNYAVLTGSIPAGTILSATSSIIKSNGGAATRAVASLTPVDAQALDFKVDDGRPSSGDVVGFSANNSTGAFAVNSCLNFVAAGNILYNTAATTTVKTCALGFNLDIR